MTYRRMTCDDVADDFMRRTEQQPTRRLRVMKEQYVPTPEEEAIRAYDEQTEQLRRYLRREGMK